MLKTAVSSIGAMSDLVSLSLLPDAAEMASSAAPLLSTPVRAAARPHVVVVGGGLAAIGVDPSMALILGAIAAATDPAATLETFTADVFGERDDA